jgi:hypothetical protein
MLRVVGIWVAWGGGSFGRSGSRKGCVRNALLVRFDRAGRVTAWVRRL